ncbi:hypothetical protein [Aliikangiella sp. IMCC44359]|uniref:hypothetical protein n=1 Tax=Aliikangiella sp. IMCC44359 TaxID=3459125 RepID=UPI00403A94C4
MRYALTSHYFDIKVESFTVYLSPDVYFDHYLRDKTILRLRKQIIEVKQVIPTFRYLTLSKTPTWVEKNACEKGFMEYHMSRGWLSKNGYNPDKVKSLEISNVENYLDWSTDNFQKTILLHELSHALYHSLNKTQKDLVKRHYKATLESGLYKNVTRKLKEFKEDAYALEEHWKYFAELSESFFGENECFPFNRSQLKEYDPTGYKLIESIWFEHKI